jgi:hypothetical protein
VISAPVKVIDVTRLSPTVGVDDVVREATVAWLNRAFPAYLDFTKAEGKLIEAITLTPEEIVELKEPPVWVLGFMANLTAVMAPVPQLGQLAHVVYVGEGMVEAGDSIHLAFVPLFKCNAMNVDITRPMVEKAVEKLKDTPFTRQLRLEFTPDVHGTSRKVTLQCGAIPAKPFEATAAGFTKISPHNLWSDVDIHLGARAPGLRAVVGAGFELLEPALRALDDLAVIPDRLLAFTLGTRLLRDHVLPTANTLDRVLDALEEDALQQQLKDAYLAFRTSVMAAADAWRGGADRGLGSVR